jgi:DUF1365 family protein
MLSKCSSAADISKFISMRDVYVFRMLPQQQQLKVHWSIVLQTNENLLPFLG